MLIPVHFFLLFSIVIVVVVDFILILKKSPVHSGHFPNILLCMIFQPDYLNLGIPCPKAFDYTVVPLAFINDLDTDRSRFIWFSSHIHGTKIAMGQPKSKYYHCMLFYIKSIKIIEKKVTKTGKVNLHWASTIF